MDIGAIERVRAMEQIGMRRGPADVTPALGVKGAQMEEDSYRGAGSRQERGMDEQPQGDARVESETTSEGDEIKNVSLLA